MASGKYLKKPAAQTVRSRVISLIGTFLFYSLYVLMIWGFVTVLSKGLDFLNDWLVKYEASQPYRKSQEVFEDLFREPDWEELYTLAGHENTTFEDGTAFAVFMEQNYGEATLSYMETSAGLSGNKKYIVQADGQKIATFTLTGGADSQTEIPQWELGDVEVFFSRNESVLVEKLAGHTVFINGVALDDSYTIRTVSTVAESYLPEGLHGFRSERQLVTGLLVEPEVTAADENGNPVAMHYDSETGIYRSEVTRAEITEEEKAIVLNGAETYCKWMIRAVSYTALANCFDTGSEIYNAVRTNDTWMQDYARYEFSEKTVYDYYRYSDSLFTARVQLSLFVTRTNGTVKEYTLDTTFFFTKNEQGNYLITNMTNVDTLEEKEQVRLTFMDGDTVLDSFFVDSATNQLKLPEVAVPEGKVFSGWVKQETDGTGKITLTVVFTPDASGMVYLPADNTLEPMTLYTLFEEGGSEE